MIRSGSNRMPHMKPKGGLSGQISRLDTNVQMFLVENQQKMCEVLNVTKKKNSRLLARYPVSGLPGNWSSKIWKTRYTVHSTKYLNEQEFAEYSILTNLILDI